MGSVGATTTTMARVGRLSLVALASVAVLVVPTRSATTEAENVGRHRGLSRAPARGHLHVTHAFPKANAHPVNPGHSRAPSHSLPKPYQRPGCANRTSPEGPRRPVFFVHIHKAGGTTFAKLATDNGLCSAYSESPNDKSSFFAKNLNPSMAHARLAIWSDRDTMLGYVRSKRLDAWATEWFAPSALPSVVRGSGALLVVTLRDPIARAFSDCGSTSPRLAECAAEPKNLNYMTQRLGLCDAGWREGAQFGGLAPCEAAWPDPNGVRVFNPPGPRATKDPMGASQDIEMFAAGT